MSQAYCSALPVAYSRHGVSEWERFGRLVSEAFYEATICAAILNARRGAFGNETRWILDGMERALTLYRGAAALDVSIVSYGAPRPIVQELIARCGADAVTVVTVESSQLR